MGNIYTIESVLNLNLPKPFKCGDYADSAKNMNFFAIGKGSAPDRTIYIDLPKELRPRFDGVRNVEIKIHILWLESNLPNSYSALVLDKSDGKMYYIKSVLDRDSRDECILQPATSEMIMNMAQKRNCFLKELVDYCVEDATHMLQYQISTKCNEIYYYVEMPLEDRVVLCGIGLNVNDFWSVGWLGKLINKNFFLTYAECSHESYEEFKAKTPSLYRRACETENNKYNFYNYQNITGKRKNYQNLVDIIVKKENKVTPVHNIEALSAGAWGMSMGRYRGISMPWIEELIFECRKMFSRQ